MHDEMKADIDKNGRCAGAHCGVMQLYDAPFSFSLNAFFSFFSFFSTIPFLVRAQLEAGPRVREQTEDTSETLRTLPSLLTTL